MSTAPPGALTTVATVAPASAAPTPASGAARCQWCMATVRLVETHAGVWMPLNLNPHPDGRIAPTVGPDGVPRAQVFTRAEAVRYQGPLWRSHIETCCAAVTTSPSGASTLLASRYPCPGCGEFLPVVLLAIGQASHPSCREAADDVGLVAGHVSTAPPQVPVLPTQTVLLDADA